MQSTDYKQSEDRLKRIVAMPIPRPVGLGPRFWVGLGINGGAIAVALFIWHLKGETVIDVSNWGPARTLTVVAFSIYVGISCWWLYRQRKLLAHGTPVVGKVLSVVRVLRRTRIQYSYQTYPGVTLSRVASVARGVDEVAGSPIIICYDPNNHQRSIMIDYSIWKIKIPD